MSSSKPPGEKKGDGFDRLVNRMKTVFKRARPKKSTAGATPTSATGEPSKPTTATGTTAAKPATTAPAAPEATGLEPQRRLDHRSLAQREKAQALFAKYGLTLHDDEWMVSSVSPVQRVEKPIRMRVRRQCHKCQTMFGLDKVCSKCNHHKCKECPRIPPKKAKKKGKASETATGASDVSKAKAELRAQRPVETLLTKPSKSGGEDLVRRTAKQRVRRYCHKCNALFEGRATECAECHHTRCKRCPRDPPKPEKYKDGYPGDVDPDSDDGDPDPESDPEPKPSSSTAEEGKEEQTQPSLLKSIQDKISTLGFQGDEPGGSRKEGGDAGEGGGESSTTPAPAAAAGSSS